MFACSEQRSQYGECVSSSELCVTGTLGRGATFCAYRPSPTFLWSHFLSDCLSYNVYEQISVEYFPKFLQKAPRSQSRVRTLPSLSQFRLIAPPFQMASLPCLTTFFSYLIISPSQVSTGFIKFIEPADSCAECRLYICVSHHHHHHP